MRSCDASGCISPHSRDEDDDDDDAPLSPASGFCHQLSSLLVSNV